MLSTVFSLQHRASATTDADARSSNSTFSPDFSGFSPDFLRFQTMSGNRAVDDELAALQAKRQRLSADRAAAQHAQHAQQRRDGDDNDVDPDADIDDKVPRRLTAQYTAPAGERERRERREGREGEREKEGREI
jgi:hypothetical protein